MKAKLAGTITFAFLVLSMVAADAATNAVVRFEDVEKEDILSFSKEEKKVLRETELGGIKTTNWKNDDREKFMVLEINSYQAGRDDAMQGHRISIAVEVTDKAKNTYLATIIADQPAPESIYTGEDRWEFRMPEGDLERPKITAYAVQYGIMDEDTYVILDEDYDDVDSMEELKERTTTPLPGNVVLRNYYTIDDPTQGTTEMGKTVRAVRE